MGTATIGTLPDEFDDDDLHGLHLQVHAQGPQAARSPGPPPPSRPPQSLSIVKDLDELDLGTPSFVEDSSLPGTRRP